MCALRHAYSQHAVLETTRANIQRAGRNCSGSRTMDLFLIVIIAAMLLTVATVFLGVLTMSIGGPTDKTLSTPLMWARVGFQALTILLLFAAIRLR
jgi:Hypoxia induced protein conserved region